VNNELGRLQTNVFKGKMLSQHSRSQSRDLNPAPANRKRECGSLDCRVWQNGFELSEIRLASVPNLTARHADVWAVCSSVLRLCAEEKN
jgi:hypothetical protein